MNAYLYTQIIRLLYELSFNKKVIKNKPKMYCKNTKKTKIKNKNLNKKTKKYIKKKEKNTKKNKKNRKK